MPNSNEARYLVFLSGKGLENGYYFCHNEDEVAKRVIELNKDYPNTGVTVMCYCDYEIMNEETFSNIYINYQSKTAIKIEPHNTTEK